MIWEYVALTDRGLSRRRNEDALLASPERRLFAVADGMGGHAAGDVASALAIATLEAAFPTAPSPRIRAPTLGRRLRAATAAAHQALVAQSLAVARQAGMGTTLTALSPLAAEPACVIAHIGDSRAYRLRHGELRQLTSDHTWVQEQIDAGMLTPAEASSHPYSSVLLRVLGGRGAPGPADIRVADVQPSDVFLLCTDGLSGVVPHADLEAILQQTEPLPTLAAQLVEAAYVRGAPDNLTVLLLHPSAVGSLVPTPPGGASSSA